MKAMVAAYTWDGEAESDAGEDDYQLALYEGRARPRLHRPLAKPSMSPTDRRRGLRKLACRRSLRLWAVMRGVSVRPRTAPRRARRQRVSRPPVGAGSGDDGPSEPPPGSHDGTARVTTFAARPS